MVSDVLGSVGLGLVGEGDDAALEVVGARVQIRVGFYQGLGGPLMGRKQPVQSIQDEREVTDGLGQQHLACHGRPVHV